MKRICLLILLVSFYPLMTTWAQDAAGITMELIATQKGDQGVDLKAIVVDEENEEPVKGILIQFTGYSGDLTAKLGEVTTNSSGFALLRGASLDAMRKAGHAFTFKASFSGSDRFQENEASVEIKEVTIILKAETIDSVNTVTATVTSWTDKGEQVPFEDGELKIYVPRMFSLLPIGEISTDEDGYGDLKFPTDLPGGQHGELTIVARIEEDDNFGNAEASVPTTWGTKTIIESSKPPRALWSPDAPLWMVITFVILMVGVWYHYGLIIYELVQVHRLSKPSDPLDYSG